jgi:heme-degrading monooxygenase HmoA
MPQGSYVYIWQFEVPPEHAIEFERTYGPDGAWAELFRSSPEYLGTELLRERTSGVYVTVDHWSSDAAHDQFRATFSTEFEALDERCNALTARETLLGKFDVIV